MWWAWLSLIWLVIHLVFLSCRRTVDTSGGRRVPSQDTVAVLIPALLSNEKAIIARTIRSMRRCHRECDLRIIVIWNSVSGNPEITWSPPPDLVDRFEMYFAPDSRSKAGNLNFGLDLIARDRPDYVAIFDADVELEPGFFTQALSEFRGPTPPAGVQGSCYVRWTAGHEDLIGVSTLLDRQIYFPMMEWLGCCFFLGSGAIFRYEAIKHFRFRECLTEDLDFSLQLYGRGHYIVSRSALTYRETIPPTWHSFVRQRTRWIQGNLQVICRCLAEGRLFRILPLVVGSILMPVFQLLLLTFEPWYYCISLMVGVGYLALRGSLSKIWMAPFYCLSLHIVAYCHLEAIILAIVNLIQGREEWVVTPRQRRRDIIGEGDGKLSKVIVSLHICLTVWQWFLV